METETKIIILWIIACLLLYIFVISVCAQDNLQRTYLMPPYKGQISGYSDWVISPDSWNELTNCYVDEQGKIVMRPGFYCWKDSVSITEEILGAQEYTKQIEGGSNTYFVFNINNKIYRTDKHYNTPNTDISGGLSFSDSGIPQFDIFYNMLFMANGEDNPIMYNQDTNAIQIGRSYFSGAVVFEDTNEIVSDNSIYFDANNYHFRVGMDLTIADSNNNGTYEIISVDSNVIIIKNTDGTAIDLTEESDSSVTLTGLGIPDNILVTGTESVYASESVLVDFDTNVITTASINFVNSGFVVGMSVIISGSTSNDGTYTITGFIGSNKGFYISGTFPDPSEYTFYPFPSIGFAGSRSITSAGSFNPTCLIGHKGKLFAGGIKQFPTYLYWSRSKYASDYFYDLWRDRFGKTDGVGHFDMQDKVIALESNFQGMLVIFCRNSIWFLRGDDPGFDILTPNQGFVFQPIPVTREMGIIGPNAKKRIGEDIFFYSDEGLQQLSIVAQQGTLATNLISLPVKNLHKIVTNNMTFKKTSFEFIPYLNTLFMLFRGTYTASLNDLLLCYNLTNTSYSIFEFSSNSEPICLFIADGFEEDPNITDIIYREADPARTLWFGSEDGKLFSLHKYFTYDLDYEDPNNSAINNITMTAITSKLNMNQPFLKKNFQRTVFLCSPQINYDPNSQGAVSFYNKVDDGLWSSASTKSFTQYSDESGTAIDYYQYLDAGVSFRGTGKTFQLKIVTSGVTGRYGLEFVGAMIEWNPIDYKI